MGGDRAGFHSWDRMDRHGEPSADRIVPERQHLQQRQRRNAEPSGQNWMITEVVEPGRTLVLHVTTGITAHRAGGRRLALPGGRPAPPCSQRPVPGQAPEQVAIRRGRFRRCYPGLGGTLSGAAGVPLPVSAGARRYQLARPVCRSQPAGTGPPAGHRAPVSSAPANSARARSRRPGRRRRGPRRSGPRQPDSRR